VLSKGGHRQVKLPMHYAASRISKASQTHRRRQRQAGRGTESNPSCPPDSPEMVAALAPILVASQRISEQPCAQRGQAAMQ